MALFDKRQNFKPYEYPELLKYKDAIRHSYWLHTEYNITGDIQDFKANISLKEKEVIKKTMLAISQIEVSIKTFWAKIYDRMPKPEIGAIGMTFSESEVRHADAYAHLLEQMGLNKEFENIYKIPTIIDRVNYLSKYLEGSRSRDDKKYALSVLLFSVFIEHVSLFGQFFIMMSFNKHQNTFKGLSNIVEATSKEEEIHGRFGLEIIQILKQEYPEWFDEEFQESIIKACIKAEIAERKILDWIFDKGELSFVNKEITINFMRNRFNNSLVSLGIDPIFDINRDSLKTTKWFDEEITVTKDNDFFNKRSTTYSKKQKSINEDDLF